MSRTHLVLALVVVAFSCGRGRAAAPACPSTEKLGAQVIASTVTVLADTPGGLGSGSGFFVAPDLVATNWHVVENSTRLRVKLPEQEEPVDTTGIVAADLANDLALVQLKGTKGAPLALRTTLPPRGTRIYAFGSPRLLEATMSDGIVSAEREVEGAERIQITAAISPGSSGGPVTDECGAVVGVAYMKLRDSENLNFAIPARFVDELLGATGAPRTAAELARAGAARLREVRAERLGVPPGVDPEKWVQVDPVAERFFVGVERRELGGAALFQHIGQGHLLKPADNTASLAFGVGAGLCAVGSACTCVAAVPLTLLYGLGLVVGAIGTAGLCPAAGLGVAAFLLHEDDAPPKMSFAEVRALVEAHNARLAPRASTAPAAPSVDEPAGQPPPPPAAADPSPADPAPAPLRRKTAQRF